MHPYIVSSLCAMSPSWGGGQAWDPQDVLLSL